LLPLYLSFIDSEQERIKFSQIYEQYRYTMLHTAMQILKDHDLAEDAVHNACLKIIEHLPKFFELSRNKTKSLLVIISKNKAIDILRKEQGLALTPLENVENSLNSDYEDPLEALISHDGYQRLVGSIAKLNDIYRTVLQLKYVHDYTNQEIAELLDISLNNVNIRLYRAKLFLKEILKEDEGHDQ